jgi:multiple sugar transport system permease protein
MLTDEVFWQALWNTIFYAAFALPLGLVVSLLTAVLLNQDIRGRAIFRTACFLPSLVPMVAAAILWWWIFNGQFGILNYVLSLFGIKGPQWLGDAFWTKPSLILMSVWSIGNSIVIYLAALQDVPRSLYESAQIDGAGPWERLRHVTIPMISPVIYFNMVMGIIGCLQVFAQPYIMLPDGGPNRSALLYAVYLFQNAFQHLRMGYACAMAWVLFIIILALTWVATRATRKHIHYET